MCEEELRVRYDRQVRLWGNATQQALQSCRLVLVGVSGAAGEMAKNLVLSGIGRMQLVDGEAVTSDDEVGSHLMRPAVNGAALRVDRMKPSLTELNPFVEVDNTSQVDKDTLSNIANASNVVVFTNQTLSDVRDAAAKVSLKQAADGNEESFYFSALFQVGPYALSVLLDRRSDVSLNEQLESVLCSPESLSTRPHAFQLVALALHATAESGFPGTSQFKPQSSTMFADGTPFLRKLEVLQELRREYQLRELQDQDVQLILDMLLQQRGKDYRTTAVDCSTIGGIASQQLVAAIAGKKVVAEGKQPKPYLWAAFDTTAEGLGCLVGDS